MRYEVVWGLDRDGEKAAFERFVDWVEARRRVYPDLHVYHYAAYERTALRRLMGEHSTREREIDDWLRQELLVDLYRVVKQALRAGVTSYSIKEIEKLYGFVRTAEVAGGDESVVLFEQWLEAQERRAARGDPRLQRGGLPLDGRAPRVAARAAPGGAAVAAAAGRARADRGGGGARRGADRAARGAARRRRRRGARSWLLAHLLYYHQREAKSQWWEWFHHLELDEDELIEDTDTIGGLELVGEPVEDGQSLVYTFDVPAAGAQDRRTLRRPEDGERLRTCATDDERGTRHAQAREGARGRAAARRRSSPRSRSRTGTTATRCSGSRSRTSTASAAARSSRSSSGGCRARGSTCLCPRPRSRSTAATSSCRARPGSGKTWQGAKAAVALMRAGRRVGVTSLSHKAIANLLSGIEREAQRQGFAFKGRKKSSGRGHALRGRRSSTRATTGATCSTRSSSSSRARRGSSRARTSPASSTR